MTFEYEGSILSQLKESTLPPALVEFKKFFAERQVARPSCPRSICGSEAESSGGSLGLGGQRLSAFLHEVGTEKHRRLLRRLKSAYPQLEDLHTRALRSGWKQLEITEEYRGEASGLLPE